MIGSNWKVCRPENVLAVLPPILNNMGEKGAVRMIQCYTKSGFMKDHHYKIKSIKIKLKLYFASKNV